MKAKRMMKTTLLLLLLATPASAAMTESSWSNCRWQLPKEYHAQGHYLSTLPAVHTCYDIKKLLGLL